MLFDTPGNAPTPVISVSELNRLARLAIEQQLPSIWVSGEVSNLVNAASGHCYFSLKDAGAQVRCVMFRRRASGLAFRLEVGQRVEINASASIYEPRGDFQLNVSAIRRAGQGALFEAFLRLRQKLEGEGLFAPENKKPLPPLPRTIGIITSSTAAALQDILTALARRVPHLNIVIYPSLVQGVDAPAQIISALAAANRRRECDLLILARGGGSIEDLWAFNDEGLARAIAANKLPIICGVGHETDVCIADLVADVRAATPTAAAELASAGWLIAIDKLELHEQALRRNMLRLLDRHMQRLDHFARRLLHPRTALQRVAMRRENLQQRLRSSGENLLNLARSRLQRNEASLQALNPSAILQRGYCLAQDQHGALVRSSEQLQVDALLRLRFAQGAVETVVKKLIPD